MGAGGLVLACPVVPVGTRAMPEPIGRGEPPRAASWTPAIDPAVSTEIARTTAIAFRTRRRLAARSTEGGAAGGGAASAAIRSSASRTPGSKSSGRSGISFLRHGPERLHATGDQRPDGSRPAPEDVGGLVLGQVEVE